MEPEPEPPEAWRVEFARRCLPPLSRDRMNPSTRFVPGGRGIGADASGGTGFAGRVRYGLPEDPPGTVDAPAPEEPESDALLTRPSEEADPSARRNRTCRPEFAAVTTKPGDPTPTRQAE